MAASTYNRQSVKRIRDWRDKHGKTIDLLQIRSGNHFIVVPFNRARQLVDAVHDLCDERDREARDHS